MIPNMNAGMLIGGSSAYRTASADFDGVNDNIKRGAGLTGAVDGKAGMLSCWLRLDGGDATNRIMMHCATTLGGTGIALLFYFSTGNRIVLSCYNTSGSNILTFTSNAAYVSNASWRHVLASWDLAISRCQLYVNDVADTGTPTTIINSNIDYTIADCSIGSRASNDLRFNGCIAEFYFNSATSLDLSVVANRRKFRDAKGKPVDLGANGSIPTGSQPIIYQRIAPGGAASDFATNLGSGGNFTVTGALTLGSNSPSD